MECLTSGCGLILITTLVAVIIAYFKWPFRYWENRNIPFAKYIIPLGSYADNLLGKESIGVLLANQYKTAKASGFKEYGAYLFWRPTYIPIDLQIIKNILTVDFRAFADRGLYNNKKADPLSAHLVALDGPEWKQLRSKLTPTFTSGKMKMMALIIINCGEQLNKHMTRLAALNEPVNIVETTGQYSMDVIGSCAFGLECNSFETPNSEFIKYSRSLFLQDSIMKRFRDIFIYCCPGIAKIAGMSVTDEGASKFFIRIVRETVEYREKNNINRNDFLQLLINLKNETQQLTIEEIAAQAFIFFVAGFETSSTTMTFALYEMSINPETQEKVRDEINEVLAKYDGKITFEALADLKYLGQVIDETLRKYPPIPAITRQTSENYKLPGTNHIIDKGTVVFIPSLGLHYDPEYFPNPEMFDPDRFSEKNKPKIKSCTYLPFGEGPRICIGMRFGMMQVKVGLLSMIKNYEFTFNEKTQTPLKYQAATFPLQAVGGVWLNATKIK